MTGMFRSFRARIFWAILLVAAVAAGLSLWLTREWLEERQLDEARTGLLREARVAGELMLRGENDLAVLFVEHAHDGIPRRLGLGTYDGNLFRQKGVQQGAFPRVRFPENGNDANFHKSSSVKAWGKRSSRVVSSISPSRFPM